MFTQKSIEQIVLMLQEEFSEELFNLLTERLAVYYSYRASSYKIPGLDENDIWQECLVCLFDAIKSFEKDREIRFVTYAIALLDNKLNTLYRQRTKNLKLYKEVVIDSADYIYDCDKVGNYFSDDISERVITKIECSNAYQKLSEIEKQVFDRYYFNDESKEAIMADLSLTDLQFRAAQDRVVRKFRNRVEEPIRGRNYYKHMYDAIEADDEVILSKLPPKVSDHLRQTGHAKHKRPKNSP